MFCSKCGKELPEGARECPECGTSTEKNIDFNDVKDFASQRMHETTQSVQMQVKDFSDKMKEEKAARKIKDVTDVFINQDERQLGIIGGGYLKNLIYTGRLAKGFGILTNRRFYYKGKCLSKGKNSMYKKIDEESSVDLTDITSSGFIYLRNISLLIAALFMIIVTAICIAIGTEVFYYGEGFGVLVYGMLLLVEIIVSLALCGLYVFYKRAIYEISFAGGSIAIKAAAYGIKEIRDFDRRLRLAKDEARKENSR